MSIVLLSHKCSHAANKLSLTLLIQICQSVSVQRLVARHLQPLLLQLCLLLHLQHTEKADDIWPKWVQTQQRSANWDCIRFVCGITPCGSCKKESVELTKRCHEGAVNVILTTPMWVVNTRLKLQGAKFRNEDLHQTHYTGIFGV